MVNRFKVLFIILFPVAVGAVELPFFTPKDLTPVWEENGKVVHQRVRLPEFKSINQNGEAFTQDQLKGKISVINFFFTSCSGICPMTMGKINSIKNKIEAASPVQFVSFSITPQADTPGKMKEFIQKRRLNSSHWQFLTGPQEGLNKVAAVFKADKDVPSKRAGEFVHSENIYLIDQQGMLRGIYNLGSQAEVDLLAKDIASIGEQKL